MIEEQPSETPSTDVQAIEQISAELKTHLKEELIDHLLETLQKQFGITPKKQIYMYRTPYPYGYDQIPFPPRFKVC
jgi:sulfite reductase beta subunit-like hemoprotein